MSEDLGLLILRVAIGLLVAGHGAQKLFGWFGGYGFQGTRGFFATALRLRPAGIWTGLAVLTELGGGLLFAAGLFHPLGALAIVAAMLGAGLLAHWPRFWITNNGVEYALVLLIAALAEGIAGSGGYALDRLFGTALPAPIALLTGLVLVGFGTAAMLLSRQPAPPPAALQPSAEAPTARAA